MCADPVAVHGRRMDTATSPASPAPAEHATNDHGVADGTAILANARAVAPVLREEAAENERRRQLTPRAVEALRCTGVFRMAMPHAWGGPEVDIRTQVQIVEELAAADGSAGWCAMIGSDGGYFTAALDDGVARDLYPSLDAVTAVVIAPTGRLDRVDGGYRVEGRWAFGSGCTHADVMIGGGLVSEGGEPVVGDDGYPEVRYAVLPAGEFEVLDTWYTTGLAGTGSHDFAIADAVVPAEQTFRIRDLREPSRPGSLYGWPGLFFANLSGVPLGIARAALEETERIVADKILMPEMRPARDDIRIRAALTRAHAMVGSARSYVLDVLGDVWATLEAGLGPSLRQRAALAGTPGFAVRSCLEAVRLLDDVVGSASIYQRCPVERHGRDLTTMSQHLVAQTRVAELAGALWLGVESAIDEITVAREGVF
jgi:indole-3-acetate monooxygenase